MAEVGEWRDLRERNQGRSTKTRLRSHGAFGPKPCGPMRAPMHTNAQPSHRARSAHIGQSGTQAEYAGALYRMRASSRSAPYSDRRCVHHRRNHGSGEHRARTCRRAGALRHRRASAAICSWVTCTRPSSFRDAATHRFDRATLSSHVQRPRERTIRREFAQKAIPTHRGQAQ